MEKLDLRKKKQYIGKVYVWKEKNNNFSVGINGTSKHFLVNKDELRSKINELNKLNK